MDNEVWIVECRRERAKVSGEWRPIDEIRVAAGMGARGNIGWIPNPDRVFLSEELALIAAAKAAAEHPDTQYRPRRYVAEPCPPQQSTIPDGHLRCELCKPPALIPYGEVAKHNRAKHGDGR